MSTDSAEKSALIDIEMFQSLDPRTNDVIAEFPVLSPQDVEEAVANARSAATWWGSLTFSARARHLKHWRQLILERFDELAGLISHETGKPMADAMLEVVLGVDHLHWAGKNAKRVLGRRHVAPGMLMFNHTASVEYEALGVVGVIGPWNYPVFTPMGSIAYALSAGNAVVFKPSEFTTKVGQWLVDTFAEALGDQGRHRSPLQLITGDGRTGNALCQSDIDKLAFTGSSATGKRVMSACSDRLIPVLMECGGKDAFIVDSDANLKSASDAAVWGAMANAGQTCVGVERIYVVDSVADRFIDLVVDQVSKLTVGGEPDADIGPITMPAQLAIIERHVKDGMRSGGQAVVGSASSIRAPYVKPVVLVDVPEDASTVTEETFGPVIVINRVPSLRVAVERANASRYALGATVFSKRNGVRAAQDLTAGMVGINSILPYAAMPSLPFGGVGGSGFGRIHGAEGLREFARPKSVAHRRFPPLLNPTSFSKAQWTMHALKTLVRVLYRW
ncbi:aldehyde dehydrogenase family protein [Rhodococcus opacus]|uniref:Aldehyde dehydrogenase n=1 Tax=Rhodococcus opacus TaxID=37919 RepID=A0A076F0D7_RHOOP|nr:aldehyde dehydrogenase family protein [Rhodococcus opacus]AII11461.1 aldehyde dehydrogenase [Rhodococcus opacus]